jgi:D-lactate dehydrogenase (cytochrome)
VARPPRGDVRWITDVCVPIARLAECIVETLKDNAGASFPIALVGHAGDGNFHLSYIIDPARSEEIDEARRLNDRLVMRALALDGTSTGEHGIGYGKMKFLEAEHGDSVALMRTIKRALDPDNRMNPGKVVDI